MSKKKWIIICLVFVIFVILSLYVILVKGYDKVLPNTFIGEFDISGMTKAQVEEYIQKIQDNILSKSVIIKNSGKPVIEFTAGDLELKIDKASTLNEVYSCEKNLFKKIIAPIKNIFVKDIKKLYYEYSEERYKTLTENIRLTTDDRALDDSYEVDKEYNLIITRGKSGKDFSNKELISDIVDMYIEGTSTEYELKTFERSPQPIDIDKVYNEIYKEVKDAIQYKNDDGDTEYIMHQMGLSFDKETLRTKLDEEDNKNDGAVITYKLDVTIPTVSIKDLKSELYEDLLGTFTTTFSTYNVNRASNIKTAAGYLDGVIVKPNEEFSFNQTVGDCGLTSRGFKAATIFVYGGTAQGVGGGICQVSTTLYNAMIYAGLSIVARTNHGYAVAYTDPGRDATISYPSIDMKFKNVRKYPVKIQTVYNDSGRITISIYGTKEDNESSIEIETAVLSTLKCRTDYTYDNTLDEGIEQVIQSGQVGYTSIAYKITKVDGKEVQREILSKDLYAPMPRIVKVGTKRVVQVSPYGEG